MSARDAAAHEFVAPGTALCFSVLMIWLAPRYPRWFGEPLPAFTREFFAFYPLWIVLSAAALAIAAATEEFPLATRWPGPWRVMDGALTVASILVVAGGIIALFLPVLLRPMPG